jgi:hypothetical protein
VTGDEVQRVQPLARNGRDFVDEWLQMPWEDAERFSSADNVTKLKQIHETFSRSLHADANHQISLEYGPVNACKDSNRHFQVQIAEETFTGSNSISMRLPAGYYQIKKDTNGYTMMSATEKPDAGCGGPDLMRKRSGWE